MYQPPLRASERRRKALPSGGLSPISVTVLGARNYRLTSLVAFGCALILSGVLLHSAEDPSVLAQQVQELQKQNQQFQQELQRQQELIEKLTRQIGDLAGPNKISAPSAAFAEKKENSLLFSPFNSSPGGGNLIMSGEGGIAFFNSGTEGHFPKGEFRVDEAKLFLDARVWQDVYAYAELNLILREDPDEAFSLGELYLDFENVSKLWGRERLVNIRAGRMYIPFGEEYQARNAIDNPLISHSLSDVWGVDEGLEIYGSIPKWSYVFAVQNGGASRLHDYNSDKAISARLGYDPFPWWHASVSAMRTGALDVKSDQFSEVWFGGGFFRALGDPATTTKFQADMFEGDTQWFWKKGHLKAAGGYAHFTDNDASTRHSREMYYYYLEAMQHLTSHLFAAGRAGEIWARHGYALPGNADFGDYFFGPLTDEIWRLSLGLGYQWNRNLVLKMEYSLEQGHTVTDINRTHENLFGVELGFRF